MLEAHIVPQEDLDFFDRNGYLIIRNALDSDQIESLIEVGDSLIASDDQVSRQTGASGRYDSFRNSVAKHQAFRDLIDHPVVLPTVVQLLGSDIHLVTSHLIYKGGDPEGTPDTFREPGWHRDYYQAQNDMGHARIQRLLVKCAYYLTDLSMANSGVTMVVPGSNRLTQAIEIPEGRVDPAGSVEPSLHPGDCLIFENRTYHAGAANQVARTRKALMMGYGYRWIKPMDYRVQSDELLAQMTPMQRFLCGEQFVERETFDFRGGDNPIDAWCEKHGLPTVRY